MMATEIIELDLRSAPDVVRVRDDVQAVLVVVRDAGRPVDLVRLQRPHDGLLSTRDLVLSTRKKIVAAHRDAGAARPLVPVSVIVCTRERPDDLTRCLESLAGVSNSGHEVIVVDNAPTTDRTAAVAARFDVRYALEPGQGLDRARNAGVHTATRDIVAFVDDDVVVTPQWVETIAASFGDAKVGCVTGLVLPLELETAAQEEFEIYCQHRRDFRRHVYSRNEVRSSAAGVVGIGANMAYRRRLLLEIGGFDVRLDAGTATQSGGETDMFARVLDAGWLIAYEPDAQVWHRHRRTDRELRACVFGDGVGVFGMLTKRLIEQRDAGAIVTAARWLLGPVMKAATAKIGRRPSPRWNTVLSETAGAACGPFCYGLETWRHRAARKSAW
jgi:GT2 family glycosyltransferase